VRAQSGLLLRLRRACVGLKTDRIDLYQLHLPDPSVPIGETLTALDGLVRAGKVRAIGCSNLSAAQLDEAHSVASELGTEHFVSTQERLNLFAREALSDEMPTCERLGMKFIPYQPLARGVLTGKYGRHRPLPADSRLFLYDISGDVPGQFTIVRATEETRSRVLTDQTLDRVEALEFYAIERGHTLVELAFGWLLSFPPSAPSSPVSLARARRSPMPAASAGSSPTTNATRSSGSSGGRRKRTTATVR